MNRPFALSTPQARLTAVATTHSVRLTFWMLTALVLVAASFAAFAAGNGGAALQAAYDQVNDMASGYGKQLIILIGFIMTLLAWYSSNSSGPILRFIGLAIFASVGLAAALAIAGAPV